MEGNLYLAVHARHSLCSFDIEHEQSCLDTGLDTTEKGFVLFTPSDNDSNSKFG